MKTTITKHHESYLANLIATRWLMFSEAAIAENHNPAKLSEIVENQVAGLYEPGNMLAETKFNAARNARIAKLALAFARESLSAYPSVLAHFAARAK